MSVAAIIALLRGRFGLDPQTHGEGAIERAIRSAMERAGFADAGTYVARLRSDPAVFDELARAVLVPETWFFRYPRSFDLLAELALQRPHGSSFRMLCVPCSTGEEPYSAAMTILDLGLDPARVRVVAMDVNAASTTRAGKGQYGRNSFRGEVPDLIERYGTWEGDSYVVGDAARAVVEWRTGSVLDESLVADGAPYDAIFCRNLLIYLGAEERRRALEILARCLKETGRLLVGHGEIGIVAKSGLTPDGDPGAFAARLPRALPTEAPARVVARATPRTPIPRTLASPPAPAAPCRRPVPAPPSTRSDSAPNRGKDSLAAAARAADAGDLERARYLCEAHLREHSASAPGHYLLGVVHASLRDDDAAQRSLERAVYLDPNHHEALVHLALQAQSRGDADAAMAWRRRAARVLERSAADGAS